MFRDVAFPRNNEAEFAEIATKLGFKKIYFLYDFDQYNVEKIMGKIGLIQKNSNLIIEIGLVVNQKNIRSAIKHTKLIFARSSDKDRFFIESKKVRAIFGFEEIQRKDYLHQRASGLNHILCELANKNDVAVGISYASLFDKNNIINSILLGRIMQNISLCQKYKVKTIIGAFSDEPFKLRAPHDIFSFFTMLGMNGKKIKESLSNDL